MKTSRCIALLFAALSIVACDDGAVRAPVTIVVDTDGARVKEDATRLRELQKGVQDDRAQLDKARLELEAARRSLATASTSEQKESLQTKMAELQARIDGGAASADAVTRAELDAQLRAQEERLKAFISAEVHGAPPPTTTTTATSTTAATTTAATTATSGPTVAQARALLDDGKSRLSAKAVEVGDVDGAVALVAAAEAAAGKGDAVAALAAARAFADKAAAVVVDKGFCRRKYERVNTLAKKKALSSEAEKKVASSLAQAQAKMAAGDFAAANSALNDALAASR